MAAGIIVIITVSDTCYKNPTNDTSGPTLVELVKSLFPQSTIQTTIIPDERKIIEDKLKEYCMKNADLIITTGGTGFSNRDVTPEATRAVIEKEAPAISVALTIESLKKTPMAMVSRSVSGICDKTLIINFPGSKKAVIECFEVVKPILHHAIEIIKNDTKKVKSVHDSMQGHVCPHKISSVDVTKVALRPRESPYPMLEMTEAFNIVDSVMKKWVGTVQQVNIENGLGYVVAESLYAKEPMPPFPASIKDDVTKVALRPRESPYPMLEMSEAFNIVDSVMRKWVGTVQQVNIEDGLGYVVAESLYAKEPMPPFPASIKDGYACISSDGAGVRRVRAAVTAGDSFDLPLQSGECARINTGAPLPPGADCVVQVEDTKLISATPDNETELEVEILTAPKPQQDVRPIGFDITLGDPLVTEGAVLDAALLGVLAGAGYQNVRVRTRPVVAILSTGNELQDPSEVTLKPAHIRDSNQTMLKALLKEQGYTSVCMGVARDEAGALRASVAAALRTADVLVCTGGVSMGEKDLLKPVLTQDFDATLHFGRVRMKPGKPSTFASCQFEGKTKYIFALPGNPVSAYVCCLLFVIRALRVCEHRNAEFPRMRVRLTKQFPLDPRPEYVRAVLKFTDDMPSAEVLGNQCSSRLLSACGASVLLEMPPADKDLRCLAAGTVVPAIITGRMDLN
ncbi:Gephyrin [Papilio xuthus]|uniref:Gephyrin n=1 Tax=Papilio xuthus TaxID=66420 RepID=A0A194Q1D2_PAPXU|nr:Gephyrin [Papilio xuthus]